MNDKFDEIEKMLDEVEKAFMKLSFEDKVKNLNLLTDFIEANEELARLRRERLMLFLRLIALIGIFVLCIIYFIWQRSLW